eukprot:TRINITY_DN10500_c0_g1_i2.p1 TRINITY_DN10500_c0_g1~~TRINITY_DN10500_c0_g1_i2.p1  ORF type:complete len:208 (-),score=56.17 TRINITY_DN10500_c0_g1_i2:51-674(-)
MIRRPPRSTHCISSAASDVYKRQINKLLIQKNQLSLQEQYLLQRPSYNQTPKKKQKPKIQTIKLPEIKEPIVNQNGEQTSKNDQPPIRKSLYSNPNNSIETTKNSSTPQNIIKNIKKNRIIIQQKPEKTRIENQNQISGKEKENSAKVKLQHKAFTLQKTKQPAVNDEKQFQNTLYKKFLVIVIFLGKYKYIYICLLYTSPSPRDQA